MIDAPVEDLDLATVIKVSQAVSGEIVPEKLIESLLRTAIEHAGADRGLLILQRDSEFLIQAEAKTCGSSVVVSLRDTPVSADELPESVVRYAARTQESVILNDTSVGSLHSTDEYIGAAGVRSVLCLPLIKQGALVALLYLENRLAAGVFTPGRISVLKVLASQAAISLENSSLYAEIREREAQIRRLIDANIVGIFFWELGGQIVEANDAFLHMVGYEREDLVSGRLRWTDLTPPEWLERQREPHRQHFKRTGRLPPYEKEYFHKDGSRVPVLLGVAGFDEEREGGVAFVVDMTERKRAEAELRRSRQYLADAQRVSHTGSWAWSPVSNAILYWSDECYRILGHDPAKGLPSFEQLLEDVCPDDRARVLESLGQAVNEASDWEGEYRLVHFDTGVRTVRCLAHPILDRSGQAIEYIGTVIDVTEQKRAEEERREYLWFLECMDRINRAMQRTNEVEGMTRGVLEEALAIFNCDRAWLLYPCDPAAPACHAVMEHTHPDYPGAFALDEALSVDARTAEVLRHPARAGGGGGSRHPVGDSRTVQHRVDDCNRGPSQGRQAVSVRAASMLAFALLDHLGAAALRGDRSTSGRCVDERARTPQSARERGCAATCAGKACAGVADGDCRRAVGVYRSRNQPAAAGRRSQRAGVSALARCNAARHRQSATEYRGHRP